MIRTVAPAEISVGKCTYNCLIDVLRADLVSFKKMNSKEYPMLVSPSQDGESAATATRFSRPPAKGLAGYRIPFSIIRRGIGLHKNATKLTVSSNGSREVGSGVSGVSKNTGLKTKSAIWVILDTKRRLWHSLARLCWSVCPELPIEYLGHTQEARFTKYTGCETIVGTSWCFLRGKEVNLVSRNKIQRRKGYAISLVSTHGATFLPAMQGFLSITSETS